MIGSYYFVIVGHKDMPLFEMDFSNGKEQKVKDDPRHLSQFIAHSSLDLIDEHKWKTHHMNLKSVDKFNQWFISAFVTASLIRFVMVHDNKNDDGIKNFFSEMYEAYIKLSLNPFYEENTVIKSAAFEKKTQLYGKKYLSI